MATILIVDDDPEIRKYLVEVLSENGHGLLEAGSGAEALEQVRNQRPDLVISDILMPEMDGFELVRRLRDQPDGAHIPVVLMSGIYREDEVRPLAQACRVFEVIAKPTAKADVLRAVGQALRSPPTVGPPLLTEAFSQGHLRLVTDKIATKIKELETANRRLFRLVDLGRQLTLEHDPLELINICCQESRSILGASYAAIGLLQDDGTFGSFFLCGPPEETRGAMPPPAASPGVVGQILGERRPVRVADVGTDPGGAVFLPPHPRAGPFLGVAIASLRVALYGLLYFMGKPGSETFTEEDEDVAVMLAAQVGVAYRSARQFQQIQDQLTRLRLLSDLVESSDDAIIGTSVAGTILSWNRGAEKIYGYAPAEMIGRSINVLVPPDRPDEVSQILERLGRGDRIEHYDTLRVRKDGRFIHVSLTISPIRDATNRVVAASAIARDITDARERAEEVMRQKEVLQTIFDHIPVMINFLDMAGRAQMVNRHWEQVLGWSIEEARSRDLVPEFYPDPRERARVLDYLLHPSPGWTEFKTRVRDGRILDTIWTLVVLSDGTRVGFGQDVTERKQAAAKLQNYYDRIQALSRQLLTVQEEERRRLARELHDEIGQSLTGLQFVLEAGPDLSLADARAKLQEARAAVDGLLVRVRELSFDLRPAMLDHLGLLPALLWLFDRYTAQTRVRVHFRHDGLNARFAVAIETAAYRVVQEALTNVARHAAVNEATVRVWVQADTLNLQIEDAGGGFNPQVSLAAGATTGLAGVQERVELLGGRFVIDSAPGAGTHLLAQMPLAPLPLAP